MANNIPVPQVGDGATYSVGSDRYPATVIKVTAQSVTIQDDDFRAGPGHNHYGNQVWNFSRNTNARTHVARWSAKRNAFTLPGGRSYVSFNGRSAYQDPSF